MKTCRVPCSYLSVGDDVAVYALLRESDPYCYTWMDAVDVDLAAILQLSIPCTCIFFPFYCGFFSLLFFS